MTEIINFVESTPAQYPDAPQDLSPAAAAIPAAAIWQRLEHFMAYRWGQRDVTWTVKGPGSWIPQLLPAELKKAEVWCGQSWEPWTLQDGPCGHILHLDTFRLS